MCCTLAQVRWAAFPFAKSAYAHFRVSQAAGIKTSFQGFPARTLSFPKHRPIGVDRSQVLLHLGRGLHLYER